MRRSYRYDPTVDKMVEYTNSWSRKQESAYVQPDIQPFLSPIDGTIISSRGGLRRHMQKHDVVMTDDYRESRESRRAEQRLKQGGVHPSQVAERKRTISDACEHVRNTQLANGTWRR